MPQKVKYVGPKDTKTFHGFVFVRDVTDTASNGANAVELPDNIANAALKHPSVFLQWDRPVPETTKGLRQLFPEALEKEGEAHFKHFAKRAAAAELLEDDSAAATLLKEKEIAGAEEQMAHGQRLIEEARAIREGASLETELGGLVAQGAPGATQADLLAIIKELQAQVGQLQQDRAAGRPLEGELADLARQMKEQGEQPDLSELLLPTAAQAALEGAGLTTVTNLAAASRATVSAITGIGPAALKTIDEALAARGLALAD